MDTLERIKKLQIEYFEIIENTLGEDLRIAAKLSDEQVISLVSNKVSSGRILYPYRGVELTSFEYNLLAFTQEISTFWNRNCEWIRENIRCWQGNRIQIPYTQYSDSLVRDVIKLASYFDTVVVTDDIVNWSGKLDIKDSFFRRELTVNFRKAAILYKLRDIVLLDVDPPLVVILPDIAEVDRAVVNEYTHDFFNEIFPGRFDREKHAMSLSLEINDRNAQEFLGIARESELFRATMDDIDTMPSSRALITSTESGEVKTVVGYLRDLPEQLYISGFISTIAMWFDTYCKYQSEAALLGNDLIVSKRMWEIHKWYLGQNAKKHFSGHGLSQSELSAVAVMNPNVDFIGDLTIGDLLLLRKDTGLEEIRKAINVDRNVLKTLSLDEFPREAEKAAKRLIDGISEYEIELRAKLEENNSKFKRTILALGLAATLGVASIAVPVVAVPAAVVGLIAGTESIRGVINRHIKGKKVVAEMRQRPIGILYQVYEKRKNN